jgi:hypothetical protein
MYSGQINRAGGGGEDNKKIITKMITYEMIAKKQT